MLGPPGRFTAVRTVAKTTCRASVMNEGRGRRRRAGHRPQPKDFTPEALPVAKPMLVGEGRARSAPPRGDRLPPILWRRRQHCGSYVVARLMEDLENGRVRRRRMVVEGVDVPMMMAGHLPDRLENRDVEDARGVLHPHGSPQASPPIAGFGEELAPLVFGGEQGDDLVDLFECVALFIVPVVVEGHGFLPHRAAPPAADPDFVAPMSVREAGAAKLCSGPKVRAD